MQLQLAMAFVVVYTGLYTCLGLEVLSVDSSRLSSRQVHWS